VRGHRACRWSLFLRVRGTRGCQQSHIEPLRYRPVLRWFLAIAAGLFATASFAQVSGSVTLASDYRFRGISLSQGRPAAQAEVSYDHASGWYAGLFGSNVRFLDDPGREAQAVGYAGYSRRLRGGLSVDAGADYSTFSGGDGYNYAELHAGLTAEEFNARLYYSPDYFGAGARTLYAELNGSHRLADKIRLIGHAGVLRSLSVASGQSSRERAHLDWLAGAELLLQPFKLQLARVANDGASLTYPIGGAHTGGVWTVRLSASF
jgi:uncharacterized protein (TIGR02001 family)